MEPMNRVRPLGPCEQYSSSRHSLGLYRCVTNACRYSVPGKAGSLREDVIKALAQVVVKLGALRVGLVDEETSKPWFVHIPSVNLAEQVEWRVAATDEDLLRIIERQNSEPWPDVCRRPPWKLLIVATGGGAKDDNDSANIVDLVFSCHHALGDGKSALLFHTHLLEALNHPSSGAVTGPALQGYVLTVNELPDLVPAQEELVRFNTSWPLLLRELWHDLSPSISWLLGRDPAAATKWTGGPMNLDDLGMHLRLVVIPASAVQPVLAACRAHGTTLTPLIHALVLASLSRRLPASTAPAFVAVTPISLRPFASPPRSCSLDISTAMANLVTSHAHSFNAELVAKFRDGQEEGDSFIWSVAAMVRSELKARLDAIPRDDIMGLLWWVSDWHGWWLKHAGKPRDAAWRVSNLGSIAGESKQREEARDWRIRRSIYAQSALVAGPAFNVNVAGVEHGCITASLSWQDGVVGTELMDAVAADLQACFAGFEEKGTFGF